MSQLQCVRARALNHLFHICTAADAKIQAEVAALGTTQLKIRLGNLRLLGGRKKYEVPVAVAKVEDVDQCTSVADWGQGRTSVSANAGRVETTAKED